MLLIVDFHEWYNKRRLEQKCPSVMLRGANRTKDRWHMMRVAKPDKCLQRYGRKRRNENTIEIGNFCCHVSSFQSQVQTTTMILASASPVLYLLLFGYDMVSGDMMLAGGHSALFSIIIIQNSTHISIYESV